MDVFIAVAVAHFLALLIPGVDFLLIARTSLTKGWRSAIGACVGIALANGVFITAAFAGVSLVANPAILTLIRLVGGSFLISVGVSFLRSKSHITVSAEPSVRSPNWSRSFALGATSGLLNPKNALFYVSLAAAVSTEPPLTLVGYGVWMFSVVLIWDVFIAIALGTPRMLARLDRILPRLTRLAGAFLVLFGTGMIVELVSQMPHP
jgi:threonine/homoserine/homoserine lactone efflux protein